MSKIRFAVLGCGHIGKRHADMIMRNTESELMALIDVKPQSELKIEQFAGIPFFSSLEEFLNSEISQNVDVVNIATPNGYHADQALNVLQNGKHVVIEKPMALTSEMAEFLIKTATDNGKQLFCVMQNRYSPPSQWLKEMVESGILGEIYMVQLNCYWNRDERYYTPNSWHGSALLDGGTLFTQFSHFLDIMYWLFGDISNINSKMANFNHSNLTELKEDSGIVQFEMVNGGIGSINFSTSVWNKNLESSITVIAQNGSIKVGGQYMDIVEVCNVKDYEMPTLEPTNPGNDYGAYKGSAANHHYVIENIADVLLRQEAITVKPQDGSQVINIIERIYQSV